jgi:uncharacterized membrane protein YidH (DUF202 family)
MMPSWRASPIDHWWGGQDDVKSIEALSATLAMALMMGAAQVLRAKGDGESFKFVAGLACWLFGQFVNQWASYTSAGAFEKVDTTGTALAQLAKPGAAAATHSHAPGSVDISKLANDDAYKAAHVISGLGYTMAVVLLLLSGFLLYKAGKKSGGMVAVAFASWFITLAVHHWIVYALTFEGEAATEGTLKLDQIVKGAANMVAAALFLVSAKSIKSVEGNKTVAALVAAFGLYSLNLGATNWSDYDKYFEQQDSEDALKAGPCIAAILATLAFTLATWGAVTDILKDGFNAQVAFTFAWSMFFFASTVTTWNTFHKVDLQFKTSPGMPAPNVGDLVALAYGAATACMASAFRSASSEDEAGISWFEEGSKGFGFE